MSSKQHFTHLLTSWCIVIYSMAIGMSPQLASGQSGSSSKAAAGGTFVKPVQAEMDAYAQILAFGGSCLTDNDGHIVEVDLAFDSDAFGRKRRNFIACEDALDILPLFTKLVTLKYPLSSLSDDGLRKIGKLRGLEELRVVDKAYFAVPGPANISDEGVKHLAGLSALRVLQIQNAKLTDASMLTIGSLVKLTTLQLRGSKITDAGIEELSGLSLNDVRLASTQVTGVGLSHLAHMPIETLGLSHCLLITDDAMNELRRFSKLKSVWLSATGITDRGLSRITNLPLEFLAVGQASITDEAGRSIQQFESLRELHFHYTRTTDEILLSLGRLNKLEHVVVSRACTPEGVAKLREIHPKLTVAGDWRHETWSNLVKIGTALLEYEEEHDGLPMTVVKNELGKPLYSWRVELLPLLGEQELYDAFHLDEPWHSEHNIQLLDYIPYVYKNQSTKLNVKPGYTLLQAVVGESCLLQPDRSAHGQEALDGTFKTATVIATSPEAAVPWTAPQDYEIDLQNPKQDLSNDVSLTFVLFADGRARFFTRDTDEATFKAFYTRDAKD